jgi:hypothetical protein
MFISKNIVENLAQRLAPLPLSDIEPSRQEHPCQPLFVRHRQKSLDIA